MRIVAQVLVGHVSTLSWQLAQYRAMHCRLPAPSEGAGLGSLQGC
jgi:hypothetical protein